MSYGTPNTRQLEYTGDFPRGRTSSIARVTITAIGIGRSAGFNMYTTAEGVESGEIEVLKVEVQK